MGKKTEKKKLSIDFLPNIYYLLRQCSDKSDTSNSAVVNDILQAILPLSDEIRRELRDYCFNRVMELEDTLMNIGSYANQDYLVYISQWKQLGTYFNDTILEDMPSSAMRWIKLKNGFCKYPADWIVLEDIEGKAVECDYAGVVECRNGLKHGLNGKPVPHFLFFCNTKYARDYSDKLQMKVFEGCRSKYPDFDRLLNMQSSLEDWERMDGNVYDLQTRRNEIDSLPKIGVFNIPVKGDPYYWNPSSPDYLPPYGAIVIPDIGL